MPPGKEGLKPVEGSAVGSTLGATGDTYSVAARTRPGALSSVGYCTPACNGCEELGGSDARANG